MTDGETTDLLEYSHNGIRVVFQEYFDTHYGYFSSLDILRCYLGYMDLHEYSADQIKWMRFYFGKHKLGKSATEDNLYGMNFGIYYGVFPPSVLPNAIAEINSMIDEIRKMDWNKLPEHKKKYESNKS